jgi:gamma-glutamyl-gamma-aminobutyrate hydrolase PuuD
MNTGVQPGWLKRGFKHTKIAPGFQACAYSEEGIIKAIGAAAQATFIVGIQAHPEALAEANPNFLNLFKSLSQPKNIDTFLHLFFDV